jgi:hypothetical protein
MRITITALLTATILAGCATASPALIVYESRMEPYYRMNGVAVAALNCRLRSDDWYRTIRRGVEMAAAKEAKGADFSSSEQDAIDAFSHKILVEEGYAHPCAKLVNSAEMDELDVFEDQLAGGHH